MDTQAELKINPYGDIGEQLRLLGVTPTSQRVQIAEILFSRPQHVSADQILHKINLQGAKASKATVYNTLGLFARKGLVRELIIDPSKVYYDSNTGSHHHFYNLDTGELTDIAAENIALQSMPDLPSDTQVENVNVIIQVRNNGTES